MFMMGELGLGEGWKIGRWIDGSGLCLGLQGRSSLLCTSDERVFYLVYGLRGSLDFTLPTQEAPIVDSFKL